MHQHKTPQFYFSTPEIWCSGLELVSISARFTGKSRNPRCWSPSKSKYLFDITSLEDAVRYLCWPQTWFSLFPCGAARWIHRPRYTLTCVIFVFLCLWQKPFSEIWPYNCTKYTYYITKVKALKVKGGFLLVKQERFYNSPQISLGFSLLPKYCSFKYLCDAVLTITNVFSKDLHNDSLWKVQVRANCTQTDLILWLSEVSVQWDKWSALMECNWVQNAHNSLDVLADTDICLRIVDDQHVFCF